MEIVNSSNAARQEMLSRMVAQYEVALLRTCYMYLRDRGLAEDAAQETFLKAYRSLDAFRGDCSEKTWLMRIAINTCRDMKRSAWFRYMDRSVEIERLPQPARTDEFAEADDLTQAIFKLSGRHKEVILLYFYQDMTMREIAGTLNISVSTVGKRIKTACHKLEKLLGKEWLKDES